MKAASADESRPTAVEEASETARKYARDAVRRLHVAHIRLRLARESAPAVDRSAARRALATAEHVLFLCHGNVCRSPMAEAFLRETLHERGVTDVEVESAGFMAAEGRESPEAAVMTARAYDVDLTGHRSIRLTDDLLDRSDVVFVMDAYNLHHLRTEFPRRNPDVFLLGGVGRPGAEDVEIPDPHGGGVPASLQAYRSVAPAVAWIADAIVEGREGTTPPRA